jgi:hypothetical protein
MEAAEYLVDRCPDQIICSPLRDLSNRNNRRPSSLSQGQRETRNADAHAAWPAPRSPTGRAIRVVFRRPPVAERIIIEIEKPAVHCGRLFVFRQAGFGAASHTSSLR